MIKFIILLLLLSAFCIILSLVLEHWDNKKHINWQPGAKPLAKPPRGKRWAYDIYKEEWYLDDE